LRGRKPIRRVRYASSCHFLLAVQMTEGPGLLRSLATEIVAGAVTLRLVKPDWVRFSFPGEIKVRGGAGRQ